MLYIFLMDTGNMLTFDINLAMETVSRLQVAIAHAHKIPEDKQVLLISGGEHLDPNQRVCSYSSGTDTNPIFLFSKSTIESSVPPSLTESSVSDSEMRDQVEGALNMPPSYETVVTRAQLALQFYDVAKEELKTCEQLVHDQHLQHQGWAAAVANLEDITMSFTNRTELFKQSFKEFLESRPVYMEVLSSFHVTLDLLSRMPLLPCLTREGESSSIDTDPRSLLTWITSQDSRNSLDQMVDLCGKGIEQFDEQVMETLVGEVQGVIDNVNNPSMKEVKGLEDRLFKLEQLMHGARRLVQEQSDMSQGFVQNQNRASNVRDNSIFPDLCASHRQQLLVMLKNHQRLREAGEKCAKAKDELCFNLHQRLRWIMYVEKNLYDVDGKLVIHHENLKRLKRKLEVIQHVYNAPKVYSKIVTEIYRRRSFREQFGQWATTLAADSSQLYCKELERRKAVAEFVGHHFFKALFPGINEVPPPFANEAPDTFDANLPPVTKEDIETLQKKLPELEEFLRIPEPFNISHHISSTLKEEAFEGLIASSKSSNSIRLDQSTSDIEVINHPDDMSPRMEVPKSKLVQDMIDNAKKDEMIHSDVEVLDMESLDVYGTPPDTKVTSQPSVQKEDLKKFVEIQQPATTGVVLSKSKSDSKVVTPSKDINLSGQAFSASPCLSPRDETSDEFTTAVFYIDESMPSSMTESPPIKAHTYRIAELQQMVHDKAAQLEASENTVHLFKEKLEKVEDKFKVLYTLAEKEMLKLKCDLLSTEKILQKEKEEFSDYIDSIAKNILSAMSNVEREQSLVHQRELEELKSGHESGLAEIQERLDEKCKLLQEKEAEVSECREKVSKAQLALEEQTALKEEHVKELTKKFEDEKQAVVNSMTLEHEVEVERVRAEFEKDSTENVEKLSELENVISEKSSSLEKVTAELEKLREELAEKFQEEKAELVKILEKDNAEKLAAAVVDVTERLDKSREDEVQTLKSEHEAKLKEACEEVAENLKKEFETKCNEIRDQSEKEHNDLINKVRTDLEKEKQVELESLREVMAKERTEDVDQLRVELTALKRELNEAKETAVTEDDVSKLKADYERSQELAVKEALAELEKQHDATMNALIQEHEKDKQDSLNSMKTSMVAEKQVSFNEALSKVVAEKDKVIEELEQREQALLTKQEKDREMIEVLMSEKSSLLEEKDRDVISLWSQEKEQEAKETQRKLEEEVKRLQEELQQVRSSGRAMTVSTMGQSAMGLSVVPIRESMSDTDSAQPFSRIDQLETMLRDKDEEISKLQSKMMELSMTQSTRFLMQHDKVSITTCHVGDLVLLCLDERHDHYVVFTVGTTLHFLHSDCLDSLNLKTVQGEARKSWVLAEVTEKEYCQAKKPQNRFKVPVGTKFYRVKAKPWDREAALKKDSSASASGK